MPLREIADNWASIYSNSAAIRSAVAFTHIGALVGGGGCAIAADRTTLRALRSGTEALRGELDNLRSIHRVVIAGLLLVIASGALLMLADMDAYLEARVFWLKMGMVAALIANGALVVLAGGRARAGDPSGPRLLRAAAIASLTLWFATTLLGAVLPNAL